MKRIFWGMLLIMIDFGITNGAAFFDLLPDRLFAKVYIGDRCEQPLDHCLVSGRRGRISAGCPCKADQGACKFILKSCHICGLSTYAGISGASGTSCSLLTLKTKHFI